MSFTANELAVAAQMSIGRVYYWFPDIPSVVAALAERGTNRLVDMFAGLLDEQSNATTPLLVRRCIEGLCDYLDQNPATTALCLTGGDDGYGQQLSARLCDLVRTVVRRRVPDISEIETELVARMAVGMTLGVLNGYTRAGEERPLIQQELVYMLSAWLLARYPSADAAVWQDSASPIQPSRRPAHGGYGESTVLYPALSPLQPKD